MRGEDDQVRAGGGRGELGLALTVLRIVRGWKQHELARAAGVRDNSITDWERGTRVPDGETARQLVAAMGFPPAALERARWLVATVREESPAPPGGGAATQGAGAGHETASSAGGGERREGAAAIQEEIERAAGELGGAAFRLTRLLIEGLRPEGAAGSGPARRKGRGGGK